MEDKIKTLLESLNTGIIVLEDALPNNFPCITFHFYNETGTLFGSGTATEEGANCQVDIWYKVKTNKVKSAVKAIKQAIINERYLSYPTKETIFETATKIYHTYFNFEIINESEE